MNWLTYALLAPAIYTIVNFLDKYIVEKHVKDYRGMPIYGGITGLVIGTVFWFFNNKPLLPFYDGAIILLSGMLLIWGAAIYFRAISTEDASIVIFLFQLNPLFVLLFSAILLKESITPTQILGFFLILAATAWVSYEGKGKARFNKAITYVMLANILWALAAVLAKFSINTNSLGQIISYESWGLGLGSLLIFIIFKSVRSAFIESIMTIRKKIIGVMFLNEIIFVISKSLTFAAYSLGPITLVSAISSTQVFFGTLYGAILTLIFPKIFHENLEKKTILKKIIAGVIVVSAIYLISQ